MHPMIARDSLDRLLTLGRQQGYLTIHDLAQVLPVDTMSADEVALVVVHLEEGGVSVELDEDLLAPARGGSPVERPAAEIVLPERDVDEAPKTRGRDEGGLTSASPASTPAAPLRSGPSVHWAVALAGALVLILLLLAVFAFGR